MALITCKECGREISESAESCPHCGHKTDMAVTNEKKKGQNIVIYIGAAAVVVGLFLLLPAMSTLLRNYDDWYFWNWNSSYADKVISNIGLGIVCTGIGISVLLRQFVWKDSVDKQNKEGNDKS